MNTAANELQTNLIKSGPLRATAQNHHHFFPHRKSKKALQNAHQFITLDA
jgi:hypothetical protein